MEQILFSCVGTSDPVRSGHDGGWLHIMRQYRPKTVCIYLSPEIASLENADHRFAKTIQHVTANWEGYSPDFRMIQGEVQDVSDLDALAQPLTEAVAALQQEFPEDEILLNLSSGTPQMQIILSQITLDLRYRTRGIQVKTSEHKAGTSRRTNDRHYAVEEELFFNEDEQPGAENRCVDPKMYYLQRQNRRQQILALLKQRNYAAIYAMKNSMPANLMQLVGHLAARDQLQTEDAKRLAEGLQLPFALYPKKKGAFPSNYDTVSEYFLMLKNLCHNKRYTDLVLRLNPFLVQLQGQILTHYLGFPIREILTEKKKNVWVLSPDALQRKAPAVKQKLDEILQKEGRGSSQELSPSIYFYNRLLLAVSQAPKELTGFLLRCERLNQRLRNAAAHQLTSITAQQIYSASEMGIGRLMEQLEMLLVQFYPECDSSLFSLYERCAAYIKEHLS